MLHDTNLYKLSVATLHDTSPITHLSQYAFGEVLHGKNACSLAKPYV